MTSDQVGRIEKHGIDVIGDAERHGRPRSLFGVWAASNVTYLYIVLGGTLVLLGLDVGQSLAVIVAGNAFWLLVGWLSVSGPASGTPSEVVTRAMFGVRGNRLVNVVLGWGVGVAYEAINLSIGTLAGVALAEYWGLHVGDALTWVIVLGTALVTFTISVYGHATIVRLSGWFTVLLLACMVVLGWSVLQHADWGYRAPAAEAVHGGALWAVAAVGFTIIASGPLSWGTGADYARYLPADTSKKAVVGWTALGGFLPSVLLAGIGVLAGTVVDMTDPQTSLAALLPGWFYPVFLLVIVAGSMTNNVLTAYSSGLALQAVGIPWTRAVTVVFDAAVGIGICAYALFVSDFLDTLNNILELTVAFLGPALAIYGVDILLRRNAYVGRDLHDETAAGRFWYRRGVNPAGAVAMALGTGAALLCAATSVFVGPVAASLDGADLSGLVGPVVGAAVYAALNLRQRQHATVDWFRVTAVTDALTLIDEPHVHEVLRANTWLLRGRDHDLLVDTGLGIDSLHAQVMRLTGREPLVVLTHGHLDHAGGAHEFGQVWAHAAETVDQPVPGSLHGPTLAATLGLDEELPELLITTGPRPAYDPAGYRLRPAQVTRHLVDGDLVDLGDRTLTVLHLPGHSPGSIALFDAHDGTLFSGDVVYDDTLLDTLVGADVERYRESMRRLRELPVRIVRPGHGASFGRERLHELVDDYLAATPVTAGT